MDWRVPVVIAAYGAIAVSGHRVDLPVAPAQNPIVQRVTVT
jgi:hypothetical protein